MKKTIQIYSLKSLCFIFVIAGMSYVPMQAAVQTVQLPNVSFIKKKDIMLKNRAQLQDRHEIVTCSKFDIQPDATAPFGYRVGNIMDVSSKSYHAALDNDAQEYRICPIFTIEGGAGIYIDSADSRKFNGGIANILTREITYHNPSDQQNVRRVLCGIKCNS